MEAPDSILPSTATDLDITPNAMDLMVKQQQHQEPSNVYYDSSSTEGSESSTPYVEPDMFSQHGTESPAQVLASLDSDTPSESLLSTNIVAGKINEQNSDIYVQGENMDMNHPDTDNDVCKSSNPEIDNNVLGRNTVRSQPVMPVPDCSHENALASSSIATRNTIENEPNEYIAVPPDATSHSEICTNANPVSTHITIQENVEPGITSVNMAASVMGLNNAAIGNALGTNVAAVSTMEASVMGLNSAPNGSTLGTNVEVGLTCTESAISMLS